MAYQITVSDTLFSKDIPGLGILKLRNFNSDLDLDTLYSWVTQSYAKYWGMLSKTKAEVAEEYNALQRKEAYDVLVGTYKGKMMFLIEKYKAIPDRIAHYYAAKDTDYGMHILVGPPETYIPGFTWNVFCTVLDFFFEQDNVKRIVVEPDVRNEKIHVLNKNAGFKYIKEIDLPEKRAHLAFCTLEDYQKAKIEVKRKVPQKTFYQNETQYTSEHHLNEKSWEQVNKSLVAKAISEFSHEVLLQPVFKEEKGAYNSYVLQADEAHITYEFDAQIRVLEHWDIKEASIVKKDNGNIMPLETVTFITDFKTTLGIPEHLLAVYLDEITSTLSAAAYKYTHTKYTAKQLAHAPFQVIEHAMTAGHPCFVANNGRIGFNNDDYTRYAPEADKPFKLFWVAGHVQKTTFTSVKSIDYNALMRKELGVQTIAKFNTLLENQGLESENYIFIPVHPWQWQNKILQVFAADIALKNLVFLGESNDLYSAQQSIRTLYNESHPEKMYTKTALSILNMGFMRGLSPHYMKSTPHITTWITNLLEKDTFLKQVGFNMLGEVATVGFENTYYAILGKTNAHNKMLSALWRESPHVKLNQSQNVMTMAALLHEDVTGASLLVELIKASPYNTTKWLTKYFQAYLSPLLHCFYNYGFVFMPHGENIIMVMKSHAPVKILMKDITEEVIVFNPDLELDEAAKRLFIGTTKEMQVLSIFTDVFDCFFRFMSNILEKHLKFPQQQFWKLVATCIQNYQNAHPELQEKFNTYDLFVPEFGRCCLNRLQLQNTQQMLDLGSPIASLIIEGKLKNPIAKFKKESPSYMRSEFINQN